MASPIYSATNSAFSAATGAKTVLNVLAGANQAISIIGWGISMDGITATAIPATVDVCQSTQGAAGTAGATPTVVIENGDAALAFQGSAASNYTVEPTTLTSLMKVYVPQFMGSFNYQYPLGQEPESDYSGGTIRAIAIRINTTATVNVLAYLRFTVV